MGVALDRALRSLGLVAAGLAAWLPIKIHSDPDWVNPPRMEWRMRGSLEQEIASLAARPPLEPRAGSIVTGSVGEPARGVAQPYPGRVPLRPIMVEGSLAVLVAGRRAIVARAGTRMPDGRRVASISRDGGRGRIAFDDGTAIVWRGQPGTSGIHHRKDQTRRRVP